VRATHGFHLRIARWVKDAALRLRRDMCEGLRHRIEHTLGGSRIIARNVGLDARQVIIDDRWVPFDPHAYARLAAVPRTESFQSGSSGANGPDIRSVRTRSSVPAAQSDSGARPVLSRCHRNQ
jgi:hypothetical protein